MEKKATLVQIENDHKITKESDYEFLHLLQNGMLLALKEKGYLNEVQYRYAEQKLKDQRRTFLQKKHAKEKTG